MIFLKLRKIPSFIKLVSRPSKITNLDIKVFIKQHVLRLDVSMQDVVVVEIADRKTGLKEEFENFFFGQGFLFVKVGVEVSI